MLTNYDLANMCCETNVPLVGIFPKDKLPQQRRQGGYIINLQNDKDEDGKDLNGTHWTGIYIEKNKAAYFDSFGFVPPNNVQLFLSVFKPYAYSEKEIQNIESGICGYFVFYFLWAMSHWSGSLEDKFNKFLGLFSCDPKQNRRILQEKLKPIDEEECVT